jgi:CelD/BcsL family acetyltransferase involved in cellulose biosynthesis/SAM-dependent methyltransferase
MTLGTAIVSDMAGLAALEAPWWDLFEACPEATPFQSPAWLLAWWRAFHPGDLRVVAVRDGERLVGLGPLYIERSISGGRLLPLGIGTSDYLDVLVAADRRGPVETAIAAEVEQLAGWQEWELTDLASFAAGRRLPELNSCHAEDGGAVPCHVLTLDPTGDDPARSLPRGKARKLRMAEHRAARADGFSIRRADGGSLAPLLDRLIDLHRRRWLERGDTGVFADERVVRCHREALPALLERGMLRLYGLERNGIVTAVQLGFKRRERAYAYTAGFDPADGHVSPGTLLMAHAIGEAWREGCRWFDFLKGDEAHKASWGARPQRRFRRVWRRRGHDIVAQLLDGTLPANVALMQLAYGAGSAAEVEAALVGAEHAADGGRGGRLKAAQTLWRESPLAFSVVQAVRGEVDVQGGSSGDAVRSFARLFDRAAAHAADGAAALYALGRDDILVQASEEIVSLLASRRVLDKRACVLDLGCGSGRMAAALAGRAAQIIGVDISAGMLAAARRRTAGRANVTLIQGSGRDLAWLGDEAVDLVLAVDVFPYIVESGPGMIAAMIMEAGRVLRPGGSLVVLNWSYRGDLAEDSRDARIAGERQGLALAEAGPAGLRFWDAALFHLVRRSRLSM